MLRKYRVTNFANMVKIALMLIKPTFKNSIKVKIMKNFRFPVKNDDVSRAQSGSHVIYIFFESSLVKV